MTQKEKNLKMGKELQTKLKKMRKEINKMQIALLEYENDNMEALYSDSDPKITEEYRKIEAKCNSLINEFLAEVNMNKQEKQDTANV